MNTPRPDTAVVFGHAAVRIEDIVAITKGAPARLTDDESARQRIAASARFVQDLWREEGVIYGVTTGYGDSCTVSVPAHLVEQLPIHLTRFHGCGLGAHFDDRKSVVEGRCGASGSDALTTTRVAGA